MTDKRLAAAHSLALRRLANLLDAVAQLIESGGRTSTPLEPAQPTLKMKQPEKAARALDAAAAARSEGVPTEVP